MVFNIGNQGPIPALSLDLTTSLDSRITFTRAGSRNYINSGVLTALATGQPAFESWGGVNRGLAIEPAVTNALTYSNDLTQAVYTKSGGAITAGDSAVGLVGPFSRYTATATNAYHYVHRETTGHAAGSTQTLSCFVKATAGATNYSVRLRMSNQYNNNGPTVYFRLDGSDGFVPVLDTAIATNVTYGYRKLSGGVYQIWITGTWVSTSTKEFDIGVTPNALLNGAFYTAAITDSVQIANVMWATANGPTGHVVTGAATASQAVESAVFNNVSWMASNAQGTFVVEHDCWRGPLIGSGANTVLGATVPGKTAIAWSGTTSDTVNNGGSTSAGAKPTFSGSDIRLLATTGSTNAGHIKSIRFYPTRLSVAELQTLTSPTVVSTATPGVLRTVSTKNRLPSVSYTTSGTVLSHQVRFQVPMGAFAASSFKLDFPGLIFPGAAAGNDIIVESCYLERVTGVAESVQIRVGGNGTFTITNGAATTVVSDVILPSAFTGLTQFNGSMEFWIRLRCRVTTAGHKLIGGRSRYDPAGAFCIRYDPAVTTPTSVSGTGAMNYSGGAPLLDDYGYCPVLVGVPASGDPKTGFLLGDSLTEGIAANTHQGPGCYMKKACVAIGMPIIEHSKGGQSHREVALSTSWTPYTKYARVFMDGMGTNNLNAMLDFFTYWNIIRNTYGCDKFMHFGLTPVTTSSDSFVGEANQTIGRAYPHLIDTMMVELEKYGVIDKNFVPMSCRGTNPAKHITNGTAFYATADGTHLSVASDNLVAVEAQPIMAAITVS